MAASWMGWENIFQVEWDKWCQKILSKNFPNTLRFGDIVEFNKMLEDGRITTDTEGAGLLREKELEDNSENNGIWGGCNPSDIHKIYRENGEIITDTDKCGHIHREFEKQSTKRGEQAFSKSISDSRQNGTIQLGHIDIITGGFPCQPFSHAGKRKGVADERDLWPEMLRTIRILKPTYVVGENVAGLVSMENGKTLDRILSDLENEGYTVESFIIPACAIGAWHRRDRIWIVAYDNNPRNRTSRSGVDGDGQTQGEEREQSQYESCGYGEDAPDPKLCRLSDSGTERTYGTGGKRCKSPEYVEKSGETIPNTRLFGQAEYEQQAAGVVECGEDVPDTNNERQQTGGECYKPGGQKRFTGNCDEGRKQWQSEPSVGGMAYGLPCGMDGYWNREPEGVPRVATGVKDRVNRLKGLGNAIVPAVAYELFKVIQTLTHENIK